jgi:hypothetical protein
VVCTFDHPLLAFLIDLPKFDCARVGGEEFVILALRLEPIDIGNFLADGAAFEGIEVLVVRLELEVVVVLGGRRVGIDGVEQYESAGVITNSK